MASQPWPTQSSSVQIFIFVKAYDRIPPRQPQSTPTHATAKHQKQNAIQLTRARAKNYINIYRIIFENIYFMDFQMLSQWKDHSNCLCKLRGIECFYVLEMQIIGRSCKYVVACLYFWRRGKSGSERFLHFRQKTKTASKYVIV